MNVDDDTDNDSEDDNDDVNNKVSNGYVTTWMHMKRITTIITEGTNQFR